jgi:putative transcriptional regulator
MNMKALRTLLATLALAVAAPALAQAPAAPVLLAADPALAGPYQGTVLFVVPSGKNTHFGFILNRPTATRVPEVLPEVPQAASVPSPVFFGGPFMRDTIFALARAPHPPVEGAIEVLPGVHMAHGREAAARVAEHFPARARFYAGVVIWQRGELDAELASGHWMIAEPDVDLVIGGSADTLWQRVLERLQTMVALR